jgi:peptide/nickel transport system permease protein
MGAYVLGRLAQAVLVLFAASIAIFILVRLTGSPVLLLAPADATPKDIEQITHDLGLDAPVPLQYWTFASSMARGDFGRSVRTRTPVAELLADRLWNSAQLGGLGLVCSLLLGIPLGVLAATHRDRPLDLLARGVALVGQSVPSFVLGFLLVAVFAGWLHVLPAGRLTGPQSYVLPVACLTISGFLLSGVVRFVRSGMLDALGADYVRMARAKGLRERAVNWRHAFPNAAIPLVTFTGFYIVLLVGGASLVVETVFAWPGVGTLLSQAIVSRDYPIVQAVAVIYVGVSIVSNLVVDLLYGYLDPRIRY